MLGFGRRVGNYLDRKKSRMNLESGKIWLVCLVYLGPDFSSVQLLSHVRLFVTPWAAAHQASLTITNSQSLLKLMSIRPVMPSNHLSLCRPLLLLPSIFPSIRVFSNESVLRIRWPKLKLQHQSFQWILGLISFRIDWLDLLAVQGTLKSLLQHDSSKTSILWCSAFFIVQLSHLYMTTGKIIALTRQTFVGKVISLLFNRSRCGVYLKEYTNHFQTHCNLRLCKPDPSIELHHTLAGYYP